MIDSSWHVKTANRASSLLYSYVKKHLNGRYLLPVNVCPDVPLTLSLAGVSYDFVDISPDTLCMDEESCIEKLSRNDYAGVVYVRTYGVLFDTSLFFFRIKSAAHDTIIIDDRCLCMPEEKPASYGADFILYSTGHCKQIDMGGGGYCLYSEEETLNLDETLYYDGTDEESIYKSAYAKGIRLAETPTGWLKVSRLKLPDELYLSTIREQKGPRVRQREQLNEIYESQLPADIQLPKCYQDWRFNIVVPPALKDTILVDLFIAGLFASSHYHSVNRLFNDDAYANSDYLFGKIINLFNDFNYSEEKAILTCKIIRKRMDEFAALYSL